MDDRRRHPRASACFAVRIDSSRKRDRVGLCRDTSDGGLLVASPSHFEVGERVQLTVKDGPRGPRRVHGRVVRSNVVVDGNAGPFCRLLGIKQIGPAQTEWTPSSC